MLNLGHLITTIQRNCHISDAKYAGNYSMCVFLLKMREYYRWENEIPLSQRLPQGDVGDWLVQRERDWEGLEDRDYASLSLDESDFDPFDQDAINRKLLPLGYVYSSGYGLFNKPHFFLGDLYRREQRDGVEVLVSSCEYARDLVAPPAMLLSDTVFVRQDAVRRYLWERYEEWLWQGRPDSAMGRAVAGYGGDDSIDRLLDRMTERETEFAILHELGELRAGRQLGPDWESMLAELPRSKAEFVARAVRDHLADALTTVPELLRHGNEPSLHFYFANMTGMRKALFPEAIDAYRSWRESGREQPLQKAYAMAADFWLSIAGTILDDWREHGSDCMERIEELLCRRPAWPA
jgi:hypothetical protein